MKILAVCQRYYPENFQITPICEQLVKDGHEVTVLTGLPNYPSGIVPEEYKHGHRDEIINGVRVIRSYEKGRKKGPINLAVNYLSFWISGLLKVNSLDGDFDLVFSYELSPIFMCLPAIKYANRHKVPLLLYCCDLWPESVKMYVHNEHNPIFWFAKKISHYVYNRADKILCQSSSFVDYIKQTHSVSADKIDYLPAFADESYLNEDFSDDNGVIDFVFLGNLGIAQNLIKILEAVDRIKKLPDFAVHFVGEGSCLDAMKAFVSDHKLEQKVFFYGRRPVEEMPKFYKLADVCLVSLKADNATGLTLPSKVQGYMAAGKPILGMIEGSTEQVIKEANCGITVKSDDVEGFANAMRDMIVNFSNYKSQGPNARQFFKDNFKKDMFMKRLLEDMDLPRKDTKYGME